MQRRANMQITLYNAHELCLQVDIDCQSLYTCMQAKRASGAARESAERAARQAEERLQAAKEHARQARPASPASALPSWM